MSATVVFRTDASLAIGTGHVMRCLALADALRNKGVACHFICRQHDGHLIDRILSKGYEVHPLPQIVLTDASEDQVNAFKLKHSQWLGSSQEMDARVCSFILKLIRPDWLIIDHYALDVNWESAQRPFCGRLMVIDDLADREHDCDLLLDQTFGRKVEDYRCLVPKECIVLCGSKYAVLRPEFAQWRPYSLSRRNPPELKRLLIAMGGIDQNNATERILTALTPKYLPISSHISVVMGEKAPWIDQVRQTAAALPWHISVQVGVSNIANLMADSDLAIGAAGATSWERCCLGLPTLLVVLADNQKTVAQNLEKAGAVQIVSWDPQKGYASVAWKLSDLISNPQVMATMTRAAADIVDGGGAGRLLCCILGMGHASV